MAMQSFDVLCLPSLNAEAPIQSDDYTTRIPEELRGRKVVADRIIFNHDGTTCIVEAGGRTLEFPVPKRFISAGSSVNIAVGLKQCGFSVAVAGALDLDEKGNSVIHELEKHGINRICFPRGTGTPLTVAAIDRRGSTTLFIHKPPYRMEVPDVLARLRLIRARYIVASSVRVTEAKLIYYLFARSKPCMRTGCRARVLIPSAELCAQGRIRRLLQHTDILQLNELEAATILGGKYSSEDTVAKLIRLGPKTVILTRGDHGSVLVAFSSGKRGQQEIHKQRALPANVVDTTGAGDGFSVGFLLAVDRNLPHDGALRVGSWVAARNIEQIGGHGGMPTREQLEEFLAKN